LTVALVVSVVTGASSRIGSFASGMFALFPIILGSSIVVMHPRIGGKATASMLANVPVPLIGMALGFVAVHYLVAPIGVWPALAGGLLVSLAWSGLLLVVRLQQQKRRQAISSSPTAP
jgi:Ca2+/Na+ antiporter